MPTASTNELAPVVVFAYSRADHTRRTLEALAANAESDRTLLYVFVDGAPQNATSELQRRIREVQEVVESKNWCKHIKSTYSAHNKGLANSIVDGVNFVTQQHGKAIVLEDDLICSPGFLRYMNTGLDLYEDDPRVMQISGFNVPNPIWAPKTGFLRVSTSWGWATWNRAWQHYRSNATELMEAVIMKSAQRFDLDGYSFHCEELQKNVTKILSTWSVKWYASIFLRDGLCLYPRKTLIQNIGFDGTGENCHNDSTDFHTRLRLTRTLEPKRLLIQEDKTYLRSMQRHYQSLLRQWTGTRLRDRVSARIGRYRSFRSN